MNSPRSAFALGSRVLKSAPILAAASVAALALAGIAPTTADDKKHEPVAPATLGFADRVDVAVPGVTSVALLDVDRDGLPDLVTLSESSELVGVGIGDGKGGFDKLKTFATAKRPTAIALADVTGDKKPDLVVACEQTVAVLVGNGNGGFERGKDIAFAHSPQGIVAADLDGDGNADLVTANSDGTVTVFLADGKGGFRTKTDIPGGKGGCGLAAADLNGDGSVDFAVPCAGEKGFSVLFGDGKGKLALSKQHVVAGGGGACGIAIGDVNGDGFPDVVITNHGKNEFFVAINDGKGSFKVQTKSYATAKGPAAIALADLDGSGKLAAVVACADADVISVFKSDAKDTFAPRQDLATGKRPKAIAVADLNRDKKADLVVACERGECVSVFLSKP